MLLQGSILVAYGALMLIDKVPVVMVLGMALQQGTLCIFLILRTTIT